MLATSYGLHAEIVRRTDEFAPAWQRAAGCGRAALIELEMDPEQLNSRVSVSELRKAR